MVDGQWMENIEIGEGNTDVASLRITAPGGRLLQRHGPLTEALIAGANNEDLTPLIERVIFQLHPSFNNPTRVVDTAPFHVTELGWGEFDIGIKIFFHGLALAS